MKTLPSSIFVCWPFHGLDSQGVVFYRGSEFDLDQCRAQVLCYMTLALLDKGHEAVYAAIERPLLFTQTAAILEVLVFPSSLPLFIRENWRLRGVLKFFCVLLFA